MRLIATILFLLVPILGVWTFVIAPDYGWWFPQEPISTFGGEIDDLFNMIMVLVTIFFLLTELLLAWYVFAYSGKLGGKALFSHGNHKLEMLWTGVPAVLLLFIAFAQMTTWAEIKFEKTFPEGQVKLDLFASQFDWRTRYPGQDGVLGTTDDLNVPFDMVVPVDTVVLFNLRSRDVLHSFFVPALRLKQDAVPGMTIPVWFEANRTGDFDLICAELCGWGHYKMAGRLRVLPKDEYEAWLSDLQDHYDSNGMEDAQ